MTENNYTCTSSSGEATRPTRKVMSRDAKRNIFFGCMIAVPILLFVIFYCIVNIDSFSMAFKSYEMDIDEGYTASFAGFENFKVIFKVLAYGENWRMITNSLILWLAKLCIGLPVSVIFSFYVYKKRFGSGFFRIILFLPNVISNLIMVYLFRFFADDAIKMLFGLELGLLQNSSTEFVTILFFNLWLGFAGQTLMITSAMSGINESVVESAQIDGVTPLRELWSITLPMIFSTFSSFIIIGLTDLFVDQMSLVTFYDKMPSLVKIRTVGYYLYEQTYKSNVVPDTPWLRDPVNGVLSYSELSAFGLMITCIVVPVSLGVRKLLDKFGPRED